MFTLVWFFNVLGITIWFTQRRRRKLRRNGKDAFPGGFSGCPLGCGFRQLPQKVDFFQSREAVLSLGPCEAGEEKACSQSAWHLVFWGLGLLLS